ncbi:hypothetical protein VTL71DRAFT_14780 [Oculimacula yallundae]|uniref:Uncharacterized protein n=1 Tax=Oculimacula yallundae TaxID=86028 RepID=A0ABR4CJG0_9HELO
MLHTQYPTSLLRCPKVRSSFTNTTVRLGRRISTFCSPRRYSQYCTIPPAVPNKIISIQCSTTKSIGKDVRKSG